MKTLIGTLALSMFATIAALPQTNPSAGSGLPCTWATTTFRDKARGISFQYPASFKKTDDLSAYFSPALTSLKGITFRAKLAYTPAYDPNAEEVTTDLGKLVFLYATKPAPSEEACYKLLGEFARDDEGEPSTARGVIHGVSFRLGSGSDAGMSHFMDSELFVTYRRGTCFLFERAVIGMDGYVGNMDGHWGEVYLHMNAIAPTIRFDSKTK